MSLEDSAGHRLAELWPRAIWDFGEMVIFHGIISMNLPSGKLTQLLKMAILQWFFPLNMVIFHSYVKLPEGSQEKHGDSTAIESRNMVI